MAIQSIAIHRQRSPWRRSRTSSAPASRPSARSTSSFQRWTRRINNVGVPVAQPRARAARGLVVLPPDWLPKALIFGDAVIAALSVLLSYWFHHTFDPFHTLTPGELPLAPYLAALPVVILFYIASLAA